MTPPSVLAAKRRPRGEADTKGKRGLCRERGQINFLHKTRAESQAYPRSALWLFLLPISTNLGASRAYTSGFTRPQRTSRKPSIMASFATHALLIAAMALGILAMPLGIFDKDPCDRVVCPKGQRCMAPDDMPRCYPSLTIIDDEPFPTSDPCGRLTCPKEQRCMALDDMPRCYPNLPIIDEPFPTDDPCNRLTCPRGQRCMAPDDMPRCFPAVLSPLGDPSPFPFPIERRTTIPSSSPLLIETPHIAACPPDSSQSCAAGQFCLELNGTPKCLAATTPASLSSVDPCRFKICDPTEFCEVVDLLAKCTSLSIFTPTTSRTLTTTAPSPTNTPTTVA
jgi:hypothetical protein